ncbi:MAG: peptidoglycan DD-metalloendopeptidase family protein [Patescibacteria group bacterium]
MEEPFGDIQEAGWVAPEADEMRGAFWARHLRRQGQRLAVCLVILLLCAGLRNAGHAGRWLAAQLGTATRTELPAGLSAAGGERLLRGALAGMSRFFAREWVATGKALRDEAGVPPSLIWPVKGGRLLTKGGIRTGGGLGLDIQAPAGTPVAAAAAGIVLQAATEPGGGKSLILEHRGGWWTVYRLCRDVLVRNGEAVRAGQIVALVGSAPPPDPTHLRFELWGPEGEIDPRPFLPGVAAADGAV